MEAPRSQLRADNTNTANIFRIHGNEGIPLCDRVMLHAKLKSITGWQNLAAFRRGQKWPLKFLPSAYLQFYILHKRKFANLT